MRQVPKEAWPPQAHCPPDLYPAWAALCLPAFYDLDTCRPVAFDVGPIPWTAINAWGREHGLRGHVLRMFTFIIRRLDRAWLLDLRERQPKPKEAAP